jgi:uncharacterized protein YprB with RNaseH-like and TPR domain
MTRVSPRDEARLWKQGIVSWYKAIRATQNPGILNSTWQTIRRESKEWIVAYEEQNWDFIWEKLPQPLHWRVFPEIKDRTAFLDVEATGTGPEDVITTIAIYFGQKFYTFIRGENLHEFPQFIEKFEGIATFGGTGFDFPIIEREFGIELIQFHFDLNDLAHDVGLQGGLKKVESKLGIQRPFEDKIKGIHAITLWDRFQQTGDRKYLQTLLAYNIEDAFSLEPILYHVYNRKRAHEGIPVKELAYQAPEIPRPVAVDESVIAELFSHE